MDANSDLNLTILLAQMPSSFVGHTPKRLSKVNTEQITASQPSIPNIDFTVIFKYANDLSLSVDGQLMAAFNAFSF